MACMTHYCCECSHEWFDNSAKGGFCPKCNSDRVRDTFDETPEREDSYERDETGDAPNEEDE